MRNLLAAAVIATCVAGLGLGGVALARGGASVPNGGRGVGIPGLRAKRHAPRPDDFGAVAAALHADPFSIDMTPLAGPSAISEQEALAIAKRSGYAEQAESVTVRHVIYTNRNMAKLSAEQLRRMGVREAPVGLDAWLVVYHNTRLHAHGPRGSDHSPVGDFVAAMSAKTGEVVEASGIRTGL